MCVIIIKPAGRKIPAEVLRNSSTINPHGLGVIWLDTWKVEYFKSREYKVLETKRPFIAHFRFATVGKVCVSNTHPFKCGDTNEWLMMNGTIHGFGNKQESDSKVLANMLGSKPRGQWSKFLSKYDCRFVTVNVERETFQIYNKPLWTQKDGVWYSKANVLQDSYVAVYGTLKHGYSNHYYMNRSIWIGSGHTKDKYPLVVRGLPYLIEDKGNGHNVEVEVYRVNEDAMKDLDRLEGHPRFYERVQVPIKLKGGRIRICWVYFCRTVTPERNEPLLSTFAQTRYKPVSSKTLPFLETIEDRVPEEDIDLRHGDDAEESEFDKNNEAPVCVNCFSDLTYDEFSLWHCDRCDEWFSEKETLKLNELW
jgi:gamma-glutamylcyclotransferase (GGCT)/AIG2-like uncharacterized protein YtfP